jgi:hypothetical protein
VLSGACEVFSSGFLRSPEAMGYADLTGAPGWRDLRICPFPGLYAAASICVRTLPPLRVGKFVAIIVAAKMVAPSTPSPGF